MDPVRITRDEFEAAVDDGMGWCTSCEDFTTYGVTSGICPCDECAERNAVMSAAQARRGGFIEIVE